MSAGATHDLDLFASSAHQVISYLSSTTSISDWSVSRIDGVEQVHLHAGEGEILRIGARVPWEETFCRRMLAGADPIVGDTAAHASYADLVASTGVRAYASVPILDQDGSVFGTLCGAGSQPAPIHPLVDPALLDVFGDLLSSQLRLVRTAAGLRRAAMVSEAIANRDQLTGLMNRRGWDLVAAEAHQRVAVLGDQGLVLMVDLDGLKRVNDTLGHPAGDALLLTAADVLREAGGAHHRAARLGGDEFAVFVEGASEAELLGLLRRYGAAFDRAGVSASIGGAVVVPVAGEDSVTAALALADTRMYAEKELRRTA